MASTDGITAMVCTPHAGALAEALSTPNPQAVLCNQPLPYNPEPLT
jgi:hypothetical protein